jgi:Ca2+-binding EF-hand superfamily protein
MQKTIFKAVASLLLAGSLAGLAYAAGPGFPRSEKSFTYIDGDNDGKLSMSEMAARAEKRLFRLDQNSDGSVGKDEIDTWLQKGVERRRNLMLADYDANRDGAITREELTAFVTAEFGKADKDGDGAVNLEESRAYRFVRAEDADKQPDDEEE